MSITPQTLKDLEPRHEFFIGIDSDGCVFDTMEIKHKECFIPQFINHFGMQPVSKYARETWEFVNLYSRTRGVNRFLAVLRVLDLLGERPEVQARGVRPPPMKALRDWTSRETKLGNASLKQEIGHNPHSDLEQTLLWSEDVNQAVAKIVRNVPPFPFFRETLARAVEKADTIVCSQTPTEALVREWQEHRIDRQVRCIAGQELGTKGEHLALAAGGKYNANKVLMIGDAPGDLKAAKTNGFLFFPINPGDEEASWKQLHEEGLERFFAREFAGEYESSLIAKFEEYLPEKPPWETGGRD